MRATCYKVQMRNSNAEQVILYFPDKGHVTFKSRAEAGRASVLEILKRGGEIKDWIYEPQFFRFYPPHIPEGMAGKSCGVRKYKIDFKVINLDGSERFEEVKNGYFKAKDKTKLKCMATYYPDVVVWLSVRRMPKGNTRSSRYKLQIIRELEPLVARVYDMAPDFERLGLK